VSRDLRSLARRAARIRLGRSLRNQLNAFRWWLSEGEQEGVPEVLPLNARTSSLPGPRINLLIPSVHPLHAFGGISTAVAFFQEFSPHVERLRIVPLREPEGPVLAACSEYRTVSMEEDSDLGAQVVFAAKRRGRTLPVCATDLFIATTWWSAHLARRLISWQSETFAQPSLPLIYLIQDYEPAFHPWSSRFLLAQQSYHDSGPTVAVFNTRVLRDYFAAQGHTFEKEYCFEPRMNDTLRELRPTRPAEWPVKRKQLVLYGRPSTPRNAFALAIESLRQWVKMMPGAGDWSIISVGEDHRDVELGDGLRLRSMGKLSLTHYARVLQDSAVGMSWMVSPHPSYPPLEMAHFGIWVLTNRFANKDPSAWHENLVSPTSLSPDAVGRCLTDLCQRVEADPMRGWLGRSYMPEYVGSTTPFPFVNELLRDLERGVYSLTEAGKSTE
jgi:O-antigen biosynthesis protein